VINSRETLAKHRLEKALGRFHTAELLFSSGNFLEAGSSYYYTMFYCARALLALHTVDSKSHSGVNHLFNTHYIATGKLDKSFGKALSSALKTRLHADYDDFYIIEKKSCGITQ
jgi:uncharacterized protein (UPF0332 family)